MELLNLLKRKETESKPASVIDVEKMYNRSPLAVYIPRLIEEIQTENPQLPNRQDVTAELAFVDGIGWVEIRGGYRGVHVGAEETDQVLGNSWGVRMAIPSSVDTHSGVQILRGGTPYDQINDRNDTRLTVEARIKRVKDEDGKFTAKQTPRIVRKDEGGWADVKDIDEYIKWLAEQNVIMETLSDEDQIKYAIDFVRSREDRSYRHADLRRDVTAVGLTAYSNRAGLDRKKVA